MATISNAMSAASIVPKYHEVLLQTVVCTQAVASDAASDQDYKLFAIGSGNTLVDVIARVDTALESNATDALFHLGIASGGKTLVSSARVGLTYPQSGGPDCTLPYSCTADTVYVCMTLGVTATAAGNVIVTAKIMGTEQTD